MKYALEPHVALNLFEAMVKDYNITVFKQIYLSDI